MAELQQTIRAVIAEYVERRGSRPLDGAVLAKAIDRALHPNGHEDTAAHWRANAAEERRKKEFVSTQYGEAIRHLDVLRAELAAARAELERLCREPPDEFELPVRQGDSVPEHLYDGSPEMHGSRAGRPIGTMLRASWARQVTKAVNGYAALRREIGLTHPDVPTYADLVHDEAEALAELKALRGELRQLLSLFGGPNPDICGGHSEPEIAGQYSSGYRLAPSARYPAITQLLREADHA